MIEPVAIAAIAIVAAAICIGIGAYIARSEGYKARLVAERVEAENTVTRRLINEVKEEQGNILSHMMRYEAEDQKRHMSEMDSLRGMMGGMSPQSAYPNHPQVGTPMYRPPAKEAV